MNGNDFLKTSRRLMANSETASEWRALLKVIERKPVEFREELVSDLLCLAQTNLRNDVPPVEPLTWVAPWIAALSEPRLTELIETLQCIALALGRKLMDVERDSKSIDKHNPLSFSFFLALAGLLNARKGAYVETLGILESEAGSQGLLSFAKLLEEFKGVVRGSSQKPE
jgi:hypothetical protein